ncbi:Hypothetical protein CAP_2306 [Chondromyces apiculatus DSM 436]|uniref:Uncharacterized protein n=1 Tax=Chondromyces apiculatus DSM 436 TaxID=1192034 RepID=A0A017TC00_9BACT|nr:Hypothetical protein CAP_2306 [Chondromyces apiculatus DSM 436]
MCQGVFRASGRENQVCGGGERLRRAPRRSGKSPPGDLANRPPLFWITWCVRRSSRGERCCSTSRTAFRVFV